MCDLCQVAHGHRSDSFIIDLAYRNIFRIHQHDYNIFIFEVRRHNLRKVGNYRTQDYPSANNDPTTKKMPIDFLRGSIKYAPTIKNINTMQSALRLREYDDAIVRRQILLYRGPILYLYMSELSLRYDMPFDVIKYIFELIL